MANNMDGDEKPGSTKRSQLNEGGFEPDDDEPIRYLFKLKQPHFPRKQKLGMGGGGGRGKKAGIKGGKLVHEDDDSRGMDDTLASFRKKLKGPMKKIENVQESSTSRIVEYSHVSGSEPVGLEAPNVGLAPMVEENAKLLSDVEPDITMSPSIEKKRKVKAKRRKDNSTLTTSDGHVDCSNGAEFLKSGCQALKNQVKKGNSLVVGPKHFVNKHWKGSLPVFSQKMQSGLNGGSLTLLNGNKTGEADISGLHPLDLVSDGLTTVEGQRINKNFQQTSDHVEINHYEKQRLNHSQWIEKEAEENLSWSKIKEESTHGPNGLHEFCDGESKEGFCLQSRDGCFSSSLKDMTPTLNNGFRHCSRTKTRTMIHDSIDSFCSCNEDKHIKEIHGLDDGTLVSCSNEFSRKSANILSDHTLSADCDGKDNLLSSCDDGLRNNPCNNGSRVDQILASTMRVSTRDLPQFSIQRNNTKEAWKSKTEIYSDRHIADERQTYPEHAALAPDFVKDDNMSVGLRAARKTKKPKHGDMAYEGDVDWENLTDESDFLENHRAMENDHCFREGRDSGLNIVMDIDNGGAAAISVGLKAHAVGLIEKIRFKEVLKRKGGLQEYVEMRNLILDQWFKDVTRILPLSDCGITDTISTDGKLRASLVREIYSFLDQSGYINFGIASERDISDPSRNNMVLKERNNKNVTDSLAADADDGVSFIIGHIRSSEKNGVTFDVEEPLEATRGRNFTSELNSEIPHVNELHERSPVDCLEGSSVIVKESRTLFSENVPCNNISCDTIDCKSPTSLIPDLTNGLPCIHSSPNHYHQSETEIGKKIIVVGAGPAGLTAARHLQRQGFNVTVLEARSRLGGRVHTDRSTFSVPVDLGASIITGVEADVATERRPDPSSLVCAQLGLELTVLNSDCPLYDIVTRQKVPADLDEALEAEYNSLLDDMVLLVAQKGEHSSRMSLEEGLEYALEQRRMAQLGRNIEENMLKSSIDTLSNCKNISVSKSAKEKILSPLKRRVMDWHLANLEYGCAALLKQVSLPHWNQDDVYGGFGGAHCMIKGGYSTVIESLGEGLSIHVNHLVTDISYDLENTCPNDDSSGKVKVFTSNGSVFLGDAVLVTVPLGCLKAETIKFSPPLPQWKQSSVQRLGFGVLNKVVLEFPEVFWDDSVDYFGATAEETNWRGQCFMFWNVRKTVGAPVLIALVVGKAAVDGQNLSSSVHVNHALMVLRKLFGETLVPDPVASVVTEWGKDPFSYGAYSYVAVGASGEDYDILARPIGNCLFFAGEATCKEHPDTVGGAMMSGLREAVRIINVLSNGYDYIAEVDAMEAAQRQCNSEKDEYEDILRRLDAVELSNDLYHNSLGTATIMTREDLLKNMFFNAKTMTGRLYLAKELLNLSVETLKSFAGTKEGLTVLNLWILDSMGKDGTQLLRQCVRLLVLVSTDLFAVRISGIGKTVKEKVCIHTSRDIRAIASQLVSVWLEVFRKEKASNGGTKLRPPMAVDSSKRKYLKDSSGKPPLHAHFGGPEGKGALQMSYCKPLKQDLVSKPEISSSRSRGSLSDVDAEEEGDNVAMSEEEQAAFAAAVAAQAALAAAEARAFSEGKCNTTVQLPKIPSFHKFARREQYAQRGECDIQMRFSGNILGKQDSISEIDSRNCKVRNWSVDFSAACINQYNSRLSGENLSPQSHSNEIISQLNCREHSGESMAVDSSIYTKAWVDTSGSEGMKDYHDIERWQSQAAAASNNLFWPLRRIKDEEESNTTLKEALWNDKVANESLVSQVTMSKEYVKDYPRGAEKIKQAVVDYVATLLMPLYKTKKIDKEGYKSIMKKSATKVMERATDAEKAMTVHEFLDLKRRNKIRPFVDKLIERHMAINTVGK